MLKLIKEIDAKTKLAGTNKLDALTFSLGINPENGLETIFGIDVFKVREVIKTPPLMAAPHMPSAVKGMASIRGNLIPVVDLADCVGFGGEREKSFLILTEYNGKAWGLIARSIGRVIRVDWATAPKSIRSSGPSMIEALTELPDGTFVSFLDFERVLSEALGDEKTPSLDGVGRPERVLEGQGFFADDSEIARRKLQEVFDHLEVKCQSAENGVEAWALLQQLAQASSISGRPLRAQLKVILTAAEMPEMDGYMLTKLIKSDTRFAGIPVVMHSSLSTQANMAMGGAVGADGYVANFEPHLLVDAIVSRWA